MLEVHPRHETVERAKTDLMGLLLEWRQRHGLTRAEELVLLTEEVQRSLWAAVRVERRTDEERLGFVVSPLV